MPSAFAATGIGSLQEKEKVRVLQALDLQVRVELEKRRRDEEQDVVSKNRIQAPELAYVSAFPLRRYIYETFPILEPGHAYKDNWHIDCLPYEQPILTEYGYMPIGFLVETKYAGNVLSFNHATGQAEWKKVTSHMKNRGSQLYDVVSSKGDKITVTGNHPIFCNGKYTKVSEMQNGDRILRTMSDALFERAVGIDQILWYTLFREIPDGTRQGSEGHAVPKMQQRQVLQSQDMQSVFGDENGSVLSVRELWSNDLPDARSHEGVVQKIRRILQPQVFRQLRQGRKEYGIRGRQISGTVPENFQINQGRNYREGWRSLLSLQRDSEENGRTPHRPGQSEQRTLEFSQSLPTLPQPTKAGSEGYPGIGECHVRSVTKSLRISETVYNIEVEGNNNYFVNGILVHNCITELLQAATVGQVKNFIINIPRRSMKSSLVCIMWPTWVWSFMPLTRWLFSSFSEQFALRDSDNCRKLITSSYYQQRFGDKVMLSATENRRRKFANTRGGFRECFGVTKGTGSGGEFVIADDPHSIDEAESDKIIQKTINWWHGTMYNSVNDPATAVRGIIHQRVSEMDITGDILAKELGYELLCLPMTFEEDHPHKRSKSRPLKLGTVSAFDKGANPELNIGDDKLWMDPRDKEAPTFENSWYKQWYKESYEKRGLKSTGEGTILWPNRFTPEIIKEIVAEIEVYGESAQLQQRPIRRGGNFFNSEDFEVIPLSSIDLDNLVYVRAWDKAGTADAGDWTVGTLMARTMKRPFTIYIIDIRREQVGYYLRMQLMKDTAANDTLDYVESKENTEYAVVIEGEPNSSGKDISTIEKDYLLGYQVIIDKPRGKKSFRAKPVKSISEAGRIKVVKAPWNTIFFRELQKFEPDKENRQDDQVDTLSTGTKYLIFGNRDRPRSSSGVA